jgi:LCP family protein required for cell wall assembly
MTNEKKVSNFRKGWQPTIVKVLTPIITVLFAVGTFLGVTYYDISKSLNNAPLLYDTSYTGVNISDAGVGAMNILLLAYDSREGKENKKLAGGGEGTALADTTIVVHISKNHNYIQAVSLPRDTLVPIPSCSLTDGRKSSAMSQAMLNNAFSIGFNGSTGSTITRVQHGASCAANTVEQNTGIHIDHYAVVDFAGFMKTVDNLGGIEICVPQAFGPLKHSKGLKLPQGFQTLNAFQTTEYARARHGLGDGSDYGRMRRQQAVIGAIINKVFKKLNFYDLGILKDFATTSLSSVTTDITTDQALGLLYSIKDLDLNNVSLFTAPVGSAPGNPNRLVFSQPNANTIFSYFTNDQSVISLSSAAKKIQNATTSPTPSEVAILDGTMTVYKISPPPTTTGKVDSTVTNKTGINLRTSNATNPKSCENEPW